MRPRIERFTDKTTRELVASTRLLALDGTVVLSAEITPRTSLAAWGSRAVEYWLRYFDDATFEKRRKQKLKHTYKKKAQSFDQALLSA